MLPACLTLATSPFGPRSPPKHSAGASGTSVISRKPIRSVSGNCPRTPWPTRRSSSVTPRGLGANARRFELHDADPRPNTASDCFSSGRDSSTRPSRPTGRRPTRPRSCPRPLQNYYAASGKFVAGPADRLDEALDQFELAQMFRQDDLSIQQEMAIVHARIGLRHFEKQEYMLAQSELEDAVRDVPRPEYPGSAEGPPRRSTNFAPSADASRRVWGCTSGL